MHSRLTYVSLGFSATAVVATPKSTVLYHDDRCLGTKTSQFVEFKTIRNLTPPTSAS